jgi:OsmC subfamily peroxiredoxin
MERKATAVWRGDVRSGRESLLTESTSLHEAQYSFGTRFENGVGTNPEELLAAAHAGCFAIAVSSQLGKIGLRPERLEATATITFQKVGEHFRDHEKPSRLVSSGSWRKPSKIRCCRQRRSDGLPGIKTFQGGDFCRCAARGDGLMRTTRVVTG